MTLHADKSGQQRVLHLVLIASLLSLAALASGKPPCPAQTPCQCTDLRIKCVQQESEQLHYLDRVPYFSPSNKETRWSYSFHELRVRDQAMTNMTLRFAWGVLNVRRVEVSSSLVRQIQFDAFQGLLGVESLNLSHNLLSSLSSDDLRDLPSLRELVLHNNMIKAVHPGVFRHTAFVSKLYLSHNLISEIPADIRLLSGLTHLYLQFNNISVVRGNAFYGLRKLIILDLGALRSNLVIERRAFCGLTPQQVTDTEQASSSSSTSTSQQQQQQPQSHSLTVEDGGLVALYLRRNILRQLDLCAIGQARSLRGLNLTETFFPCSCQALSFASRSDWQRRYGFSPRFVTYEPSLLHACNLECPPETAEPCPDACGAANDRLAVPPLLQQTPADGHPGSEGGRGSWGFGSRLSVREGDGGGAAGSTSVEKSSGCLALTSSWLRLAAGSLLFQALSLLRPLALGA